MSHSVSEMRENILTNHMIFSYDFQDVSIFCIVYYQSKAFVVNFYMKLIKNDETHKNKS